MPYGEDEVHHLLVGIAFVARFPGGICKRLGRGPFVDGAQERRLEGAPSSRIRPYGNPLDFLITHSGALRGNDVIGPAVLVSRAPDGAEDDELLVARRNRRGTFDVSRER